MKGKLGIVLVVMLVLVTVLAAACGQQEEEGVIRIKVAYPSTSDMSDLPSLLVYDRLVDKGYAVLPVFFSDDALSIEAVSSGEAEVGTGGARAVIAAMSKGAPLKFIVEQAANEWSLYTTNEIQQCSDMDGKRLAIHSESGSSAMMTRAYIRENCDGISPNWMIVPGSENRAAALMAGEIDATPAELSDAINIDQQRPGEFNLMANFGRDLANLKTSVFYANETFLEEHPGAVKDFIQTLLEVHREMMADPNIILEEAPKYFDVDEELLPGIAQAYGELELFDPNGGLSLDALTYSLDFYYQGEGIEPGLTAEKICDLSFLEDVLEDIGEQ
jgi:NitT/TauT family transport system substrate-binding protein